MLKVVGCIDRHIENIESDSFVPFSVRFNDFLNPNIYLLLISKDGLVLEVAIDLRTGVLEYLTLVNIVKNNVTLTDKMFFLERNKVIQGTPVFSKEYFCEKRIVRDETSDIRLSIGKNFVKIIIANGRSAEKYYLINRVYIGVDGLGGMCEVIMNNMSDDEISLLKDCLGIKCLGCINKES